MDNENKKLKELGYKINGLKRQGKKKVEWNLTNAERKFVEELLGKENVVPFIYQITTKNLKDFKDEEGSIIIKNVRDIKSSIVREVHYANKAGKKTIGRSLKKQEMEELEKHGIKYRPIKFIIYLN